jgi:hypothetical protein
VGFDLPFGHRFDRGNGPVAVESSRQCVTTGADEGNFKPYQIDCPLTAVGQHMSKFSA